LPQSRLFLHWLVFGLSQGAQAGTLSPFKCQGPGLANSDYAVRAWTDPVLDWLP
jgi:hypothetical protein